VYRDAFLPKQTPKGNYGSTDVATSSSSSTSSSPTPSDNTENKAASNENKADGVATSAEQADQAALDTCEVQLVALGLGTPGFAKKFAKQYNFAGKMYVDPSKTLFQRLGMTRGSNVTLASCLFGFARALVLGVTRCWCQCCAGDVIQNGGVVIFDRKLDLVFEYKSRTPSDHVKPDAVVTAARKALADS